MKKIVDENGKTFVEKKPFYKKVWFWLLIVVVVIAIASQTGDEEPQKIGEKTPDNQDTQAAVDTDQEQETDSEPGLEPEPEPEPELEPQAPTVFAVGDIIQDGHFTIVVNEVEQTTQGIIAPDDGKVYFIMDVTIENNGTEEENISSLLMFDLKDGDGRSQDLSIGAGTDGSLNGTILPSEKLTGEIAFETEEAGELNLYINLSVFGGKTIKVNVRN